MTKPHPTATVTLDDPDNRGARQWWGSCEDDTCAITITIELSMDSPATTLNNPRKWNGDPFFDCPVCGSPLEWGGSKTDTTWDKEQ